VLTEKDMEEVQEKIDFATGAGLIYLKLKNRQSDFRHTLDEFRYILLNPEIATDLSEARWPDDPSKPEISELKVMTSRACDQYATFIVLHQLGKLTADLLTYQENLDEFIHLLDGAVFHASIAEEHKIEALRAKRFKEAEAND
jgi:hypothetical protein|tara:strand:+ start:45 stop:473 length:429 start_codon:yes stop_codon:yes gene_type:complete